MKKVEHSIAKAYIDTMSRKDKNVSWEHFEHKADIGVCGRGLTKEQAFEQTALALTAVITEPQNVKPKEHFEIRCQADDDELLLADWLNSLLYEMSVRGMLLGRFEVKIEGRNLYAMAWGEKCDVDRHRPAVEIKGATYTALSVRKENNGRWVAQCVVDV